MSFARKLRDKFTCKERVAAPAPHTSRIRVCGGIVSEHMLICPVAISDESDDQETTVSVRSKKGGRERKSVNYEPKVESEAEEIAESENAGDDGGGDGEINGKENDEGDDDGEEEEEE